MSNEINNDGTRTVLESGVTHVHRPAAPLSPEQVEMLRAMRAERDKPAPLDHMLEALAGNPEAMAHFLREQDAYLRSALTRLRDENEDEVTEDDEAIYVIRHLLEAACRHWGAPIVKQWDDAIYIGFREKRVILVQISVVDPDPAEAEDHAANIRRDLGLED